MMSMMMEKIWLFFLFIFQGLLFDPMVWECGSRKNDEIRTIYMDGNLCKYLYQQLQVIFLKGMPILCLMVLFLFFILHKNHI
ncbi:hypothetical protein BDA99DRAFT_525853 [Phascolomyces articulosus]|uniref:Uncharacterized protein n=1 Tax=Phascolomyces articulosus TaxID=60185 RepID=A0AAD5K283_9FUNG|nr:hypothetical protein BDA99DRAFT_525853 [Phascolomyces articulosus]